MWNLDDEVSYGISINGAKPTIWFNEYPKEKELDFWTTPQCKSVEVIESNVSYFKVGRKK